MLVSLSYVRACNLCKAFVIKLTTFGHKFWSLAIWLHTMHVLALKFNVALVVTYHACFDVII